LLSGYAADFDYITLDEALTEDLIEVMEKDEAGSVPELKVLSKSPKMILILDGEELVGAKQNRIVNTTILIQGKSTTVIPVSCVEQGRWSYESPSFHSKERLMSAQLRGLKAEQVHRSIRTSDSFRSDQSEIWDEISSKAARMEAESPTMAMSEMYEKKRSKLSDYVSHFRLVEMQVGAVFSINGKVVGLDSFGTPSTFAKVFKKLVESYALDAIDWSETDVTSKTLRSKVTRFLRAAGVATLESRPSVGLGTDFRLESRNLNGFALAHEDQVLHLSVFARSNEHREEPYRSRLQRFSNRRRYRR
jgi:flavodoxin